MGSFNLNFSSTNLTVMCLYRWRIKFNSIIICCCNFADTSNQMSIKRKMSSWEIRFKLTYDFYHLPDLFRYGIHLFLPYIFITIHKNQTPISTFSNSNATLSGSSYLHSKSLIKFLYPSPISSGII